MSVSFQREDFPELGLGLPINNFVVGMHKSRFQLDKNFESTLSGAHNDSLVKLEILFRTGYLKIDLFEKSKN